jgi:peptide chain release factor
MAKFNVSPQSEKRLLGKMEKLGVAEEDLLEKFIKGGGPGGQKINKTSSCVYLLHRPTGIEIKCQRTRSQALNRFYARRELCERLEERILGRESKRQQEIEKIRRQKRRRSRKQKERMLKAKHERSVVKKGRTRVPGEEE